MDFAGKWKYWFVLSAVLIGAGIISIFVQGFNLGNDFTGGNLYEIKVAQGVDSQQVRDVLTKFDLEKSSVQSAGENKFLIRTEPLTEEKSAEVTTALDKDLGGIEVLRNNSVSAVVGGELTRKGILAMVIAAVLIVLYISWRFEFYYAVGGVAALVHDLLIMVGFMSIFQLEVDSTFVAAVLTILGYSINDTVVIFDRIRENSRSTKYKGRDMVPLINDSIMQTMRRTIFTAAATDITLVILILVGGATTKVFCMALLAGCISGTYSTIFIASPVMMLLKQRRTPKKQLKAQRA